MRRILFPASLVALAVGIGGFVLSSAPAPVAMPATGPALSSVLADQTTVNGSTSLSEGQRLFEQTCSTCHGVNAQGSALAPNLQGLGSATVDLWVSSGWMPLAVPTAEPTKKPALFNRSQTVAIANYVASIRPGGISIPTVDLKGANVAEGFNLFSLNCAPCHTITGAGDALSSGLSAPALHGLSPIEVDEAVLTGPGNMPRFVPAALSSAQVADVVAFVTQYIEHPTNPGGVGLGGVGPVAEGFIGLFIGVGACMLVAMWIGDRTEDEDHDEHGTKADGHQPEAAHV